MLWIRFIIIVLGISSFTSCNTKADEKSFPFNKANKIEIISYEFGYEDIEDDVNYKIVNGQLGIAKDKIRDRIVLTDQQVDGLFQILYTEKCPENYAVADCYNPAHRIVFYDSKQNVIAYLELCLSCIGYRISEKFTPTTRLCDLKMKELEQFFRSVGIKHFNEM